MVEPAIVVDVEPVVDCPIVKKPATPMTCVNCVCEGCSMAEKAKEENTGVAS